MTDPAQIVSPARSALNAGHDRAVAVANYNIGGESGTLQTVSGAAPRTGAVGVPTTRFFTTFPIRNNPRTFDAEVKILEYVAQRYAGTGATGWIDLYVDRAVCASCAGVISQFREMFGDDIVLSVFGP